jgi:signal transduction histidine kinase
VDWFGAYAAHEFRNELTLQLVLAGAALSDPEADIIALRAMGEHVIDSCRRQERLLDAILTLARSEHPQLQREPLNLAATAAEVLRSHDDHSLRRVAVLGPARTIGHPELVERLVTNLVENAIRHNIPGGELHLATSTTRDRAFLTIANSGPSIPPDEIDKLFLPFRRFRSHQSDPPDGIGLGLAVVRAIADAHGATLRARPRREGGLRIAVGFPRCAAPRDEAPLRGARVGAAVDGKAGT